MTAVLPNELGSERKNRAIEVAKPGYSLPLAAQLQALAASSGTSYGSQVRTFIRLAFGAGRLSFEEFAALGAAGCFSAASAEPTAFVGLAAARKIWHRANYRLEYHGLLENKIACNALLAAYGFATTTRLALYSDRAASSLPTLLRSRDDLRVFLRASDRYPMFGKPVTGIQSLGSASLDSYDERRECVILHGGRAVALDDFIADLQRHYRDGYLFERREIPHAAVRELCGERLATVRLLTARLEAGPNLLRACLKLPAGGNGADNFWRTGNLLAQLDRRTGRIERVMQRTAGGVEDVTRHPDSGAALIGRSVPNYEHMVELALSGATVFGETALIGWDIAPVDRGVVVVELNNTPDFMLNQLADRRGILDDPFRAFLAERRSDYVRWRREMRRGVRQH